MCVRVRNRGFHSLDKAIIGYLRYWPRDGIEREKERKKREIGMLQTSVHIAQEPKCSLCRQFLLFPGMQILARDNWIEERKKEMFNSLNFHCLPSRPMHFESKCPRQMKETDRVMQLDIRWKSLKEESRRDNHLKNSRGGFEAK